MIKVILSSLCFELAAGVLIGVVDYFQLSAVDVEYGSHEDVLKVYACIFASFQENAFIFDVVL